MAIPKKHYPDLGNDASYVWNFFASFTEVIILEETSVGLGKCGCLLRLLNVCRCDGHVKLGHNSLRKPVGERHLCFSSRFVVRVPFVYFNHLCQKLVTR